LKFSKYKIFQVHDSIIKIKISKIQM